MMKFEQFVAFRYLRGKRILGFISLITYISIVGVFLGTFVLIVALSIANGFEKEVRDKIVGTFAHARIFKYQNVPLITYDTLIAQIKAVKGVTGASPYIFGRGVMERDEMEGIMFMGLDQTLGSSVITVSNNMKEGTFSLDSAVSREERRLPGILIGQGLADKLGVSKGSEVICITGKKVPGEVNPVPKMMRFVVNGIFEIGFSEYDQILALMSIRSAQSLLDMEGVEGIQIKTVDLFKAGEIARTAVRSLGGYPFRSIDWLSENKSLFQWITVEKYIMFLVISLIIVVASFNIVSSLLMMIIEKRREIGIIMGMGGTRRSIMKIFMLNGIVIGFIGSTAGTLLGLVVCFVQMHWRLIPLPGDIYIINKVPVLIKALDVIGVYITSNIICILAAAFPAWLASRILPAESIRYE